MSIVSAGVGIAAASGAFNAKAPKRKALREAKEMLAAYTEIAPQVYDLNAQYDPQYAMLARDIAGQNLFGTEGQPGILDIYRRAQPQLNELTSTQRRSDVGDLLGLTPDVTAAVRGANPETTQLRRALTAEAMNNLGGALSPLEERYIRGGVNADFGSRGMGNTPANYLNEALALARGTDAKRQSRLAQAQQTLAILGASDVDPISALLRGSSYNAGSALGQASGYTGNPPSFDPFTPYAANMFGQNAAAKLQTNLHNSEVAASGASGIGGSMGGGGGGGGGGGIMSLLGMFCWVAREVYGDANPRWKSFRNWVWFRAPRWFFKFYWRHGERIAGWLRDKPRVKGLVRRWMEARIEGDTA